MTAELTAVAKNAGTDGIIGNADDTILPSSGSTNRQLNPNTQTFTYTITASGAADASCTPPNSAPVIASDNASRTVDEGQTASNTGTWSDANAGDTVNLSASVGDVVKNTDGTWSWSYDTTDGPDNSQTVTITATDNNGASSNTTFSLTVNNVAPTTTLAAANPISVNESSTTEHTYSYSISDPGTDTVSSVLTSCGTNGSKVTSSDSNTDTSGSFKCKFDDGNKLSDVSAQATDSDTAAGNTDTQSVNISNVNPSISGITASVQNALAGKNVTFTGSATDVSAADTSAGFFWQWSTDGINYGPSLPSPFLVPNTYSNQYTTSFSSCGTKSVSARATDKDLGTSAAATSPSVNVYNASYLSPLNEGAYNTVQAGRVVPVKISIGCASSLTGLQPSIQLLKGEQDGGESTTGTDNVETLSVSSADQTGIMRAIDGGYIYNLQVPSTAKANDLFTIRVNPFGGNNASSNMYIILKIRK